MFRKLTFLTIILKTSAIQKQSLNSTSLLAIDTHQLLFAFAVGGAAERGQGLASAATSCS